MSAYWENPRTEEGVEFDVPSLEVEVSDNPIVGELLGPDGAVIRQVRERRPPGFHREEAS